jgi:hypothetical protein
MLMSLVLLVAFALGMGLRRSRVRILPILVLAVPALAVAPMDRLPRAYEGHDLEDAPKVLARVWCQ